MLEKAATIKRFEYLHLGKKLNTQTDTAKKQYQKLDNSYEFDKIIKKEELTFENFGKSDLIYNSNYSFYKYYHYIKKFDNPSLESKYSFLAKFFNDLNNVDKLKTQKKKRKKQMGIIQLQNYTMTCQEPILMNITNYQMLKETK